MSGSRIAKPVLYHTANVRFDRALRYIQNWRFRLRIRLAVASTAKIAAASTKYTCGDSVDYGPCSVDTAAISSKDRQL